VFDHLAGADQVRLLLHRALCFCDGDWVGASRPRRRGRQGGGARGRGIVVGLLDRLTGSAATTCRPVVGASGCGGE
jgi:hypothetical protein